MIDLLSSPIPSEIGFMIYTLLFLVITACLSSAVWRDATARGANRVKWTLVTLVFGILAVDVYAALCVRRSRGRETPPDRSERTFWTVGIGGSIGVNVTPLVTPPDPMTTVPVTLALVLVSIAAVRAIDRYRGSTATISGQ